MFIRRGRGIYGLINGMMAFSQDEICCSPIFWVGRYFRRHVPQRLVLATRFISKQWYTIQFVFTRKGLLARWVDRLFRFDNLLSGNGFRRLFGILHKRYGLY